MLHHETTSAGLLNDDIITGLAKRFVHDGVGCELNHFQLVRRSHSLCAARVGYLGSRNQGSEYAADLGFQAGTRVALGLSSFHCHSYPSLCHTTS